MENEKRLIDANALKTLFNDIPPFIGLTAGFVKQFIDKAPTIEATPVVNGYWVDHYICSNCGKRSTAGLDADVWTCYEPPFCPNCGANMDGDGNG